MSLYCDQDVLVTEEVFYKLLPWIKDLNLGLYLLDDEIKCPACGSNELKKIGFHYTSISKYQSYRCNDCGHISRDRNSILTRDENKKIIVSVN
jgi:DNA-directed RNA polymerase subunit RPC12/RpoP